MVKLFAKIPGHFSEHVLEQVFHLRRRGLLRLFRGLIDKAVQLFEERWREWAGRPPKTSPAAAAQEVVASLGARRQRRRPRLLVAAAAVLVAVGGIAIHRGMRSPGEPVVVETAVETPALGAGEVLMWLDEETPLYMTFQAPDGGSPNGGTS